MFERLQTKWKVNSTQLFLVLLVFALGGSATGWLGKIIMNWLSIERGWLWTLVYVIVITLIWPVTVLLVSIPFGQFAFFTGYLKRIGSRMGLLGRESGVGSWEREVRSQKSEVRSRKSEVGSQKLEVRDMGEEGDGLRNDFDRQPVNIAIFASGTGTNAKKIIEYFGADKKQIAIVKLIACNKPQAGVLNIAKEKGIPTLFIEKEKFFRGNAYVDELKAVNIHFIVLAGFLWKIPQQLIDAYRNKIVNIHPALLPDYGGKGMYGSKVHEAVINAGDKESGITIHYVDEHYDNGDIIFQARVPIADEETPGSLAEKIHILEHSHYPRIIEQLILQPNGR